MKNQNGGKKWFSTKFNLKNKQAHFHGKHNRFFPKKCSTKSKDPVGSGE